MSAHPLNRKERAMTREDTNIQDILNHMGACSDSIEWAGDFRKRSLLLSVQNAWDAADDVGWLFWLYHAVGISERTFVLIMCDVFEYVHTDITTAGMDKPTVGRYIRKLRNFAIQGYCDDKSLRADMGLKRSSGKWGGNGCWFLYCVLGFCENFCYQRRGFLLRNSYVALDGLCWNHPERYTEGWRENLVTLIKSRVTLEEVIDLYNQKYTSEYPYLRIETNGEKQ